MGFRGEAIICRDGQSASARTRRMLCLEVNILESVIGKHVDNEDSKGLVSFWEDDNS